MQVVILKQPLYGSVYWNGKDFIYTSYTGANINDSFIYSKSLNGQTTIHTKFVNSYNTAPSTINIELTANVLEKIVTINKSEIGFDSTTDLGAIRITEVYGNRYGKSYTDGENIYYIPEPYNDVEVLTYVITDKEYFVSGTITINLTGGIASRDIPVTGIRRFAAVDQKLTQLGSISANIDQIYNLLNYYSGGWENVDYIRYNAMTDIVENGTSTFNSLYRNKPKYESFISGVTANSAKWDSDVPIGAATYDLINPKVLDWKNEYTTLTAYRIDWNNAITTTNILSDGIYYVYDIINTTNQTIVDNATTTWDNTEIAAITANYFPLWYSLYNTVTANSSIWNKNILDTINLSAVYYLQKIKFDNTTQTLISNYLDKWDLTNLNSLSSIYFDLWNTILPVLSSNYKIWNTAISTLTSLSSNYYKEKYKFDNLTETVITNYLTKWIAEDVQNFLNTYADTFNSSLITLLSSYTPEWNTAISTLTSLSSNYYKEKYKFDNVTQTVIDNYFTKWIAADVQNFLNAYADIFNSSLITLLNLYAPEWNTAISTLTSLSSNYEEGRYNFNNTRQTVLDNYLSIWNLSSLNQLSALYFNTWDNTYNTLTSYNSQWNNAISTLTSLSSNYNEYRYNFNNTLQTVLDNYLTIWNLNNLNQLSALYFNKWNNVYNTLTSYAPEWNTAISTLTSLSSNYEEGRYNFNNTLQTVLNNYLSIWNLNNLNQLSALYFNTWDNTYNTLTSYNSQWNVDTNTIALLNSDYNNNINYTNFYNIVQSNSSILWGTDEVLAASIYFNNWINLYNNITAYSASWNASNQFSNAILLYNNLTNTVTANSATIWDSSDTLYLNYDLLRYVNFLTLLKSSSSVWDTSLYASVSSDFNKKLSNYESLTQLLTSAEGLSSWGLLSSYNISNYTPRWDYVFNFLFIDDYITYYNNISDIYNTFYIDYNDASLKFDTFKQFVDDNIIFWDTTTLTNLITTNNIKWNSVYNTIYGLSSNWFFNNKNADPLYNYTQAQSSKLINLNTTLTSNSGYWNDVLDFINLSSNILTNGNETISVSVNDINIRGNLTVKQNLSVYGIISNINTEIITTSSFTVTNETNDDAFVVTKIGGYGGITTFKNPLSVNVLDINANRTVGINTSAANTDLTVIGNISANGYIYPFLTDTITLYRENSAKYETTYNVITSLSSGINTLNSNKQKYNQYSYYVNLSSSIINDLLSINFINYDNMYNISIGQSSNNVYANDFINLSSVNFNKDDEFRNKKQKYDTLYNVVTGLSTGFIGGTYEIHNTFSYQNLLSSKIIHFIVPENLKVLGWTILADKSTITTIDVLSTTYLKYNPGNAIQQTLISLSNKPSLNNQSKNRFTGLDSSWSTNLIKDSIIILKVTQNTAASAISVNIKVSKYK